MPNLYPEIDTTLLNEEDQAATEYKRSYFFDFEKMDFARTGGNAVKTSTGTEAWEQWCIKNLLTARYACFAYSTDYGSEIIDALNTVDRKEAESNIRRSVIETLEADARTERVEDIAFNWSAADAVEISCKIVGVDGQTGMITVNIGG